MTSRCGGRGTARAWTLHVSGALSVVGKGSIGATWPFEGSTSTTYDVDAQIGSSYSARFAVLARAAASPDPGDVGCELELTATGAVRVRTLPDGTPAPVAGAALPGPVRIRVTIAPAGAAPNLRCEFRLAPTVAPVVTATVAYAPGRVAFASDSVELTRSHAVRGIAIYERDDAAVE